MGENPGTQKRLATNVNRGLAWIGVASSLVGILDIVAILVILNNWVSQTEYGIATLVVWVFPILDQATDLGLSAAVIQREDHDDAKISTVFWINLMMAIAMFSLLCGFAPIAARSARSVTPRGTARAAATAGTARTTSTVSTRTAR
jgi:O-antigen/teichoic acid export membrane protein